eukprot:PhM_4_TR18791/c0_g1_i3/m.77433/K08857/NEK1_4_5; NIMA (never in mitosis gene a)-related kinase 1/4/5
MVTFDSCSSDSVCSLSDFEKALVASRQQRLDVEIKLIRQIGNGGNGNIYLAEYVGGRRLQFKCRTFAVKQAKPVRISLEEAFLLRSFNNRNVVKVFDSWIDSSDGMFYIAMELATSDLNCVLKAAKKGERPPPSCREITSWLRQCCLALDLCHRRGIIHRDIKPHNMLLFPSKRRKLSGVHHGIDNDTSGLTLKLTDFGVSGVTMRSGVLEDFVGTPHYMAPEVVLRDKYDTSVDMWSLGVCLFEWLTLRRPFNGRTVHDVVAEISRDVETMPEILDDGLSSSMNSVDTPESGTTRAALVDICRALLRRRPGDRLTAQDVLKQLC